MQQKDKTDTGRLDFRRIEAPEAAMVEVLRKKTPQERVKLASAMWDSAWQQVSAVVRSLHPGWDEVKIRKEVIRRLAHESI